MLFKKKFLVFVVLFIAVFSLGYAKSSVKVVELSCNHSVNPTGVLAKPVFGWKLTSVKNGQKQTAYQILVSTSLKNSLGGLGDVWDSKKTDTDAQINIDYQGKTLTSSSVYYWKVKVWDKTGKATLWSKPAQFITGIINPAEFKAEWITSNKKKEQAAPLFRKAFTLAAKPEKAVIHISGLGYYELYVNGKKVGDHVLDPGQTNYDDYAFYVTYNIDSLLQKGENVIGVMLGDGFYNQNVVWGGRFFYGPPTLWSQLDMQVNGETQQLLSDESWTWTDGPIQSNNVYAGEVYDANKEVKGWSVSGLNTDSWTSAYLEKSPPPVLRPQNLQPIKKMQEIVPVKMYKTPRGTYMFDMGQNFAGFNRLKIVAPKGTRVTMVMAEELLPNGNLNHFTIGIKATGVKQAETYIAKGEGVEIWEPRFTYHGFRYVEVSGLPTPPSKDLLTGIVVHSAVAESGSFSSSNNQFNKLHQLSHWTFISNLHSIPTDCPAREKCGWLGDAHAMGPATIYNYDMQNFWLKFIDDVHSTSRLQANTMRHTGFPDPRLTKFSKPAGLPYMIAPGKRLPAVASPDWGTAVVQLPWYVYKYYGNKSAIINQYSDMKQWVNYVGSLTKDHIVYEGLGDWCPPGGSKYIDCPIALSSTAFHYYDLSIMKQVAGLLGNKKDSLFFADAALLVKTAFIQKFYDSDSNSFGSHTANSMALDFGLTPYGKEELVANAIAKTSKEKFDGFMFAGIFGLQRLFGQLSDHENSQAAFDILNKKGENSFEYMWKHYGATTLWEVLPVKPEDPKDDDLQVRSHSHPMQGGFDAFFYEGIGGIKPDISNPGFKKIILAPKLMDQLKWANTSYNSVYGEIVSNWKMENRTFTWDVKIPVNTSAEIRLPAQFSKMKIDGKKINDFKSGESQITYQLPAGSYQLVLQ